jgi:hypothetical protein
MRSLTSHEKRTLRLGAAVVALYFLLFGGWRAWSFCQRKHIEYLRLGQQAQQLKREIALYQDKAAAVTKLMQGFKMDPAGLSRRTAVAEASAAIQQAAAGGGVAVGAVRESGARPANKELGTLQLEANGQVLAILSFLGRLESIGYPLIVETVQLTSEAARPGLLKLNLTIVVLDFDQWKKVEASHA